MIGNEKVMNGNKKRRYDKIDKITEAIEKLPDGITCFLLEIGTGKMEVTKAIGKVLKAKKPLSILFSIDEYNDDITDYQYAIKHMDLDDNVSLFGTSKQQFLKNNQTKFHIIFAHNGVDAIPFKEFLTTDGQVVIISKMEVK